MGWLKQNEWDCAANERRKEKAHRREVFEWMVEEFNVVIPSEYKQVCSADKLESQ